jgi:hypothetical protein
MKNESIGVILKTKKKTKIKLCSPCNRQGITCWQCGPGGVTLTGATKVKWRQVQLSHLQLACFVRKEGVLGGITGNILKRGVLWELLFFKMALW